MTPPRSGTSLKPALWALMMGNFVIGTGIMAVPGALNDISHSLDVSIPQAGQPITAGAILMGISPAICTPPAAASVGLMVSPEQRGRAITFVFIGRSVASVMGMPISARMGGAFGWRWAFGLVSVMAVLNAAWVWCAMPDGIRPTALSRDAWRKALGSAPLMLTLGVPLL